MTDPHPPHRQDPRYCSACKEHVMPVHVEQGDTLIARCPDCGRPV